MVKEYNDFYWESKPREGYVELLAYYTNINRGCIRCQIMCPSIEEIESFKKKFEEIAKFKIGGAWRPIDGAVWKWNGRCFAIDKSQIEMIRKDNLNKGAKK